MRIAMRPLAVLLVTLALSVGAPGAQASAGPHSGSQGATHAAPAAAINLGELFGDENEPDENEPEEGASRAQPAHQGSGGVSVPVVLVLVALAGALGGYVYLRIRRLVLRVRAWGRGLWARL
jgi:hypothetical protein